MAGQLKGVMIGAGFFAQFHADGWKRMPDAAITAVVDPIAERGAQFAGQWGIAKSYLDAEEMLEREKPDFVDIVTRPDSHLALAQLAAQRKIHVICQKPMAPSFRECERMVETCRDAGVRLVIHENWRWQPWYREIKRLSGEGRLGAPFQLSFRMRTGDGLGPSPYQVQPYFRDMRRLLIYETLVHFLDTFRFLAGEIESVFCTTKRVNPAIKGEDCALIQVRFTGGADGLIDANRISGDMPPKIAFGEFRLEGDRAMIRVTPDGDLFLTGYGSVETPHSFDKRERGYKGDSVHAMQKHFIACLKSGRTAESEGAEYLRTVALVEACYRSAETGRVEKVG